MMSGMKAPRLEDSSNATRWNKIKAVMTRHLFTKKSREDKIREELAAIYDHWIRRARNTNDYPDNNNFFRQLEILKNCYSLYFSAELITVAGVNPIESDRSILTQVLPWQISRFNWAAIFTGLVYSKLTQYFTTDGANSAAVKRLLDFVVNTSMILDNQFKDTIGNRFLLALNNTSFHLLDEIDDELKKANFILALRAFPWIPLFAVASNGHEDPTLKTTKEINQ